MLQKKQIISGMFKSSTQACLPKKNTTNPTATSQEHDVDCQIYDSENSLPHSEVCIVQQFGTICARP